MAVRGARWKFLKSIDPNRANLELSGTDIWRTLIPPSKYILPCRQSTTPLVGTGFNGGSGWRFRQTKKICKGVDGNAFYVALISV